MRGRGQSDNCGEASDTKSAAALCHKGCKGHRGMKGHGVQNFFGLSSQNMCIMFSTSSHNWCLLLADKSRCSITDRLKQFFIFHSARVKYPILVKGKHLARKTCVQTEFVQIGKCICWIWQISNESVSECHCHTSAKCICMNFKCICPNSKMYLLKMPNI